MTWSGWWGVVASLFFGCGSGINLLTQEAQLVDSINDERSLQKLPDLEVTDALVCAARNHAVELTPGSGCIATVSLQELTSCGGGDGVTAVVAACGQLSAAEAVRAWTGSPDQRAILFDRGQAKLGVGVSGKSFVAILK